MAMQNIAEKVKSAAAKIAGFRVKKTHGGHEATVYTNGKYAFKIVYPVKADPFKKEFRNYDVLRKHDPASAAEQTARYLGIFTRNHPNIAKVHFILPFWMEHRGIGKPVLLVVQDWKKANCKQPVKYAELFGPTTMVGSPIRIAPELEKIISDVHPRVVSNLGKNWNSDPNAIRMMNKDGSYSDVVIDCALMPEVLHGGTRVIRSRSDKILATLKFQPQVREACSRADKCYCYWPNFVKNASEGFGKIPDDLSLRHFKQIPEISPVLPIIKKHLAERDKKNVQ